MDDYIRAELLEEKIATRKKNAERGLSIKFIALFLVSSISLLTYSVNKYETPKDDPYVFDAV
jgi:hypothetical protein